MALNYATGIVTSLNGLYDGLSTFMGTCGWSLTDTVTTRDKVFSSTGSDGAVNLVFRLMSSAEAGNPFSKNVNNPHNIFPWIFAMGYNTWNSGSHSGTQGYGQVGPWLTGSATASGFAADSLHILRYNVASPPIVTALDAPLLGRTRRIKTADCYENPPWVFDGRRKFYSYNGVATTQVGWCDLSHGESNSGSGGVVSTSIGNSGGYVLVHDKATDKDFVYLLWPTSATATQWQRYDIEANTWATLAAPIWSTSAGITGSACVWDGLDTIYALEGAGTTNFGKYSISGNTWTTLTATPVARSSSFNTSSTATPGGIVYCPAALTGLSEDVIYAFLAVSTTVIYRYDVTSNAWRSTSGTGALTAQSAVGPQSFLLKTNTRLLFSSPNTTPGTLWRADLTQAGSIDSTWVSFGVWQSALRIYSGITIVDHIPAKVRAHASFNTTYWFLGDADSVTVVTKVEAANSHYYWMTFGRFNGSNRTEIMTTTATASGPAAHLTIAVDDSSKYSAGETVLIWDPATGTVENSTIFQIVDGTHIKMSLIHSYGIGSRVGIDPTQWGAGGNGFFMCPTDPMGNNSDNEPAQYVMECLPDSNATARSSPGRRGLYQPVPISIFNTDSTTAKYETRGFVRNTFCLSTGSYPSIQAEETVKIAGHDYIFFPDTETSRYTVDTRGILIGPID